MNDEEYNEVTTPRFRRRVQSNLSGRTTIMVKSMNRSSLPAPTPASSSDVHGHGFRRAGVTCAGQPAQEDNSRRTISTYSSPALLAMASATDAFSNRLSAISMPTHQGNLGSALRRGIHSHSRERPSAIRSWSYTVPSLETLPKVSLGLPEHFGHSQSTSMYMPQTPQQRYSWASQRWSEVNNFQWDKISESPVPEIVSSSATPEIGLARSSVGQWLGTRTPSQLCMRSLSYQVSDTGSTPSTPNSECALRPASCFPMHTLQVPGGPVNAQSEETHTSIGDADLELL